MVNTVGSAVTVTEGEVDKAIADARALLAERRRQRELEALGESAMSEGAD